MHSTLVNDFLNGLKKELSSLPNNEKNNYITEIEDHLFSLIEEKKAMGVTEQLAIESSLSEFPNPKVLAHDYIKNNKEKLMHDPTDNMDFNFRYKSALIVMGLAELALLLTDQTLNLYLGIIGLAMLLIGNILVIRHKNWNKDNIKQLLWVTIGIWVCLLLALFFFFRRNDIDYFLIGYMIALTILIIIQHFITYKTVKSKNYKL